MMEGAYEAPNTRIEGAYKVSDRVEGAYEAPVRGEGKLKVPRKAPRCLDSPQGGGKSILVGVHEVQFACFRMTS